MSIEERIPASHPLRRQIHKLADQALDRLNPGISQLVILLRPDAYQNPCQLEQLHKWPQLCPLLG